MIKEIPIPVSSVSCTVSEPSAGGDFGCCSVGGLLHVLDVCPRLESARLFRVFLNSSSELEYELVELDNFLGDRVPGSESVRSSSSLPILTNLKSSLPEDDSDEDRKNSWDFGTCLAFFMGGSLDLPRLSGEMINFTGT